MRSEPPERPGTESPVQRPTRSKTLIGHRERDTSDGHVSRTIEGFVDQSDADTSDEETVVAATPEDKQRDSPKPGEESDSPLFSSPTSRKLFTEFYGPHGPI